MLVVAGIEFDHKVEAAADNMAFGNFGNGFEGFDDSVDIGVRKEAYSKVCNDIEPDGLGIDKAFRTDYHFVLQETLNTLMYRSSRDSIFACDFEIGCTCVCGKRVKNSQVEIVENCRAIYIVLGFYIVMIVRLT